ncbi:hypothetical protein TNCV_1956561 [Trichonephila clavipes]|nr:hypothetical protein TNCV_1956561 [Trichonephila clavipes]
MQAKEEVACVGLNIRLEQSLQHVGVHYPAERQFRNPSSIVVSDADCCVYGPGFECRRRHGCLQMHSAFVAGGTLNSRRAASPLVRLVDGEEKWDAPDHPRVFSLKNEGKPS